MDNGAEGKWMHPQPHPVEYRGDGEWRDTRQHLLDSCLSGIPAKMSSKVLACIQWDTEPTASGEILAGIQWNTSSIQKR
jgi:hypothetical protein